MLKWWMIVLIQGGEEKGLWLGKLHDGKTDAFLFAPEADKFDTEAEAITRLENFTRGKLFSNSSFAVKGYTAFEEAPVEAVN